MDEGKTMNHQHIRKLLHLENIPRWVVVPTVSKQSVAEHSFNVMVYVRFFLKHHKNGDDPHFQIRALEAAMDHDCEEAVSGDTPSTSKAPVDYTTYAKDHGEVAALIKMADIAEAIRYAFHETRMGNTYFETSGILEQLQNKFSAVADNDIDWISEEPMVIIDIVQGTGVTPSMEAYTKEVFYGGTQ